MTPFDRIAFVAIFAFAPLHATPVISEFLARNANSLVDGNRDSSDWIEIHNSANTSVALENYHLTDDPDQLKKWAFPLGTSLTSDERLVVFASSKNRLSDELHTNFSLSGSGGYLALIDPQGNVVSEFTDYPDQQDDTSYGISSSGTVSYLSPTPNNVNGPALSGFVEDTVFSHKRGFYDEPFSVAITSATPGATIRYTLNGTKPNPSFGFVYSSPLRVTSTTNLRVVAYKDGMVSTNVDAQTYLFTGDIVDQSDMLRAITSSPTYEDEVHEGLKGLPVVSLSFRTSDVLGGFGIYRNYEQKGRTSERQAHFEYFDPNDPLNSTHEPGGVRIHGGNSREHPKKALRLYFRNDYGDSRLRHEIFPDSKVDTFKNLLLRGGGHDAWTFQEDWDQATLIRNEFLHRVQLGMHQPSPRGHHVNLFLNGNYWGIYELQELPHAEFNADHQGGEAEDWDVVKHGGEVEGGNDTAWNELIALANAGIDTDADYQAIQEYLDLDHFIDAMIQRIWASDEDWLSPFFIKGFDVSTFFDDKNWYVGRKSRNGTSKFFFYSWDAEMSMGIPFAGERVFNNDFSRIDTANSPGAIYNALRRHQEFQVRFGDRLHKHLFNEGVLTSSKLQPLWDSYSSLLNAPIVAESARWGTEFWGGERNSPMTRNSDWLPAVNWVRNNFLINRPPTVISQFRAVDLYPDIVAPSLSPFGGDSTSPVSFSMSSTSAGSTIYYTTDGTDPRTPGSSSILSLVGEDHVVKVIIPTSDIDDEIGTSWRNSAEPSNIDDWTSGTNGVGYEASPTNFINFTNRIRTQVSMRNINSSAYLRFSFNISDQENLDAITSLSLGMRYDDGFIAYLNGTLAESENATTANWNSSASETHNDSAALNYVNFNLTDDLGSLQIGENVLAIHGLNRSTTSSDFLIQATLLADTGNPEGGLSPTALTYASEVHVSGSTTIKARTLASDGSWSALTEAKYLIGIPASSENLLATELHYHPLDASTAEEIAISTNPDDYEFIELLNTSSDLINLSYCVFSRGFDFNFPIDSTLAAGERMVIVSNRAAFLARYGASLGDAIVGEFANDTKLSNKGENIILLDAKGAIIFDFAYNDKSPWPESPDGDGPSLVLSDVTNTLTTELGDSVRWQPSFFDNGAPQQADEVSFDLWALKTYGPDNGPTTDPNAIPAGANEPNLILYAQGSDLNEGPLSLAAISNKFLALTFQIRTGLPDYNLVPQLSHDLITWEATSIPISATANPAGTTTVTVRDPNPVAPGTTRYFRLSAQPKL